MPELPFSAQGESAISVARRCAHAASDLIRSGFGSAQVARIKGGAARNVVTEVDVAAEHAVAAILGDAFPDHALLAEETAAATQDEGWMWVVDPIDGTKNFSRGIPHFCFSMALCYAGRPELALTFHPLLHEEYLAVRGAGTTLNGTPVRVRHNVERLEDAVISMDLGYDPGRGSRQLETLAAIWPNVQSIRVMGSAALGFAFAAAARWDLFVHASLEPWDLAAGWLLVEEAGGVVVQPDGSPPNLRSLGLVAGAPGVVAEFVERFGTPVSGSGAC